MTHRTLFFSLCALLIPVAAFSQESKVATVDFERVVVESASGKKAQDNWNAKYTEHQKNLEAKQKEIDDAQNNLKSRGNVLSEAAKADITRDIDKKTTDLNRLTEDAQKEMEELRTNLLGPISENAQRVLQQYAAEKGYTVVIDVSNPQTNIVYVNTKSDITQDVIKLIDSQPAPAAAAPAAAPSTTPATAPKAPATPPK
jgi:outer membrane protein